MKPASSIRRPPGRRADRSTPNVRLLPKEDCHEKACLPGDRFACRSSCWRSRPAPPIYTRQEDVIYGRKFGTALTMDVFTPKENANGAAVVLCISGGWVSDHDKIQPMFVSELLKRGYTVLRRGARQPAEVHDSRVRGRHEPRGALHSLACRRFQDRSEPHRHQRRIGRRPSVADAGLRPATKANPKAKDPVDRESSRVQAVACFFPPTDFLNYGKPGVKSLGIEPSTASRPPFDFHEQDPATKMFKPVDMATREKICKDMSPSTTSPRTTLPR